MASVRQADFAIRFYSNKAANYDHTWHPDFSRRFNEYLEISLGQRVLDLACGTGVLTFLEADRVGATGRVVGVDITPNMLRLAKEKKTKGGGDYSHVEFYEGDILDLDAIAALQGQTFDVITVASALVLFPDPGAAIKHWAEYLKPGGYIAVDSTHPRNLVSGIVLERTARRLDLPISYNRQWSTSEHALRQVLDVAGLEVEKIVTVDNQAGYGKRYYEDSDWDDHFVEKVVMGDTARTFANHEIRRKAQAIFKEEWEKLAIHGRVEEVDAVFLGIARKPVENPTAGVSSFSGGCRCGSVRYTCSTNPTDVTFCYCRACQQLSGSGYLPFADVPTYALKFTASSSLTTLKLSDVAERTFCSSCGSPISMVYGSEKDTTALVMGSIDVGGIKGEWPNVSKHIFLKEKAPWTMVPSDGAPRFEGWSQDDRKPVEAYSTPR